MGGGPGGPEGDGLGGPEGGGPGGPEGGGPGGPEGGGPEGVGRNADRSGSSPSGTGLAAWKEDGGASRLDRLVAA